MQILTTKKFYISRDVIFHETIFLFAMTNDSINIPASPFHSIGSTDYSYYHHPSTLVQSDPGPDHNNNQPMSPTLSPPNASPIGPSHPNISSTLPHASTPICHPTRPALRRSNRIHRVPNYLSDNVLTTPPVISFQPPASLNAYFSLNHHISPTDLYPESQSFVMSVSHDCDPSSYEGVATDPAWKTATTQEFNALHENNT